jgi:hypothetical protein
MSISVREMKRETPSAMMHCPFGQKTIQNHGVLLTQCLSILEKLTFSLMVTLILTSFNDVFNYRGYSLKNRNGKGT